MSVEKRCPLRGGDAICGEWCGMFVDEVGECGIALLASSMAFFADIYWQKFEAGKSMDLIMGEELNQSQESEEE